MGSIYRNTATRDRHRAIIRRQGGPCWICGQPIDYTLPHMDPMQFVVDHVIPLARGGEDTLENKAPAHRACNSAKAARLPGERPGRRRAVVTPLSTSRQWW